MADELIESKDPTAVGLAMGGSVKGEHQILNKPNIQLKDGDGWLIDENSIGARWTLECCGCGRHHQFELIAAGPGAYQITITACCNPVVARIKEAL